MKDRQTFTMDRKYIETVNETKRSDCDYILKVCEDCDIKHSQDKCFNVYFRPLKWMRVVVKQNTMYTSYWHNIKCDGYHEGPCEIIVPEKPSFWSGLPSLVLH